MATGRFSPGAESCYVVAGAPEALWDKPGTVGELFRSEQWMVADVYRRHEVVWIGDGNDCKKLTEIPSRVETVLAVDHVLSAPLERWRVKAIRIEPDATEWLKLDAGRLALELLT
jgi:hypothetical protein